MKKLLLSLVALIVSVSSNAMSYEQAREQALFLADKMAYELNLSDEQYEAVYEINLDYLMGVTSQANLYGDIWTRRNLDLSYVLLDWQYRLFLDAAYFYRPLYWSDGFWHFHIYTRYPRRDYFYFGCPHFYHVYRGGHSWVHNGGHSWYHGRSFGPAGNNRPGMRDNFNNGHYGHGGPINTRPGADNRNPQVNHNGVSGHRGNGVRPGGNPGSNNGARPGGNGRPNGNEGARPGGNGDYRGGNPGGMNNGSRPNGGNPSNGVRPGGTPGSNNGARPGGVNRGSQTTPPQRQYNPGNVQRNEVNRGSSFSPSSGTTARPSGSSAGRSGGSPAGGTRSGGPAGGGQRSGGGHSGRR